MNNNSSIKWKKYARKEPEKIQVVRLTKNNIAELKDYLESHSNVNSVYYNDAPGISKIIGGLTIEPHATSFIAINGDYILEENGEISVLTPEELNDEFKVIE